jgi:hypothetical protein
VAYFQNRVLVGDDCILPARYSLDQAEERGEANSTRRREWLSSRALARSIQRSKYDTQDTTMKK